MRDNKYKNWCGWSPLYWEYPEGPLLLKSALHLVPTADWSPPIPYIAYGRITSSRVSVPTPLPLCNKWPKKSGSQKGYTILSASAFILSLIATKWREYTAVTIDHFPTGKGLQWTIVKSTSVMNSDCKLSITVEHYSNKSYFFYHTILIRTRCKSDPCLIYCT